MQPWLERLDHLFPLRCGAWLASVLVALGWRDTWQSRHAVLHNDPVIGRQRLLFEFVRVENRQPFIEADNEATPFSRTQRSLVCQRAKGESDKRPFGTQAELHADGHEWINHSLLPTRSRATTSASRTRSVPSGSATAPWPGRASVRSTASSMPTPARCGPAGGSSTTTACSTNPPAAPAWRWPANTPPNSPRTAPC